MKSIADFKRKLTLGAKVDTKLYWYDKETNQPVLQRDYGTREVSVIQSNMFAIKTQEIGKDTFVNSWCNWPKKNEFQPVNENECIIRFSFGELHYKFL